MPTPSTWFDAVVTAVPAANVPWSNGVSDLGEVLADAEERLQSGASAGSRVIPTGFTPLDTYLGGGLRSGDLTVLGGAQGLGKSTMVLQMLRSAALRGEPVLYLSFEHPPASVLERLIAIEAGTRHGIEAPALRRIREALDAVDGRRGALRERLSDTDGGAEAVEAVEGYAERFVVHRSSGVTTDLGEIGSLVRTVTDRTGRPPLVAVDYLQKVAVPGLSMDEEQRLGRIVEGLKDLALAADLPVVAVSAADREGLTSGRRLRINGLRGAQVIAYEADVVVVMNEKYDVVARHHLVYDTTSAERYRNWVVVSIEKNRSGLDRIDLEFRKRFEQGRFELEGQPVSEQLVDERIYVE